MFGKIGLPEVLVLVVFIPMLLVMAALYFLPTFIAHKRRHVNRTAITLNVFEGWTFLGWMGALVWSPSSKLNWWRGEILSRL